MYIRLIDYNNIYIDIFFFLWWYEYTYLKLKLLFMDYNLVENLRKSRKCFIGFSAWDPPGLRLGNARTHAARSRPQAADNGTFPSQRQSRIVKKVTAAKESIGGSSGPGCRTNRLRDTYLIAMGRWTRRI